MMKYHLVDNCADASEKNKMHPHDFALLERQSWFGGLPSGLREAIVARVTLHGLAAGSHIYRLGDPPNGLHALLDGQVSLVSYSATGLEMVGMVVRPGFWFGELSVLDGKARPHDAIANSQVRTARLCMAAITDLTARDPAIWLDIALLSCEHQRMGLRNTARIQTEAAVVRLIRFLLGHVAKAPDHIVRLTQDDLARVIGVSRQRINGLIGDLKARALTRPVYGGLEIPDAEALRRFLQSLEMDMPAPAEALERRDQNS